MHYLKINLAKASWILLDVDGTLIETTKECYFSLFNEVSMQFGKSLTMNECHDLYHGVDDKLRIISRNQFIESLNIEPSLFWEKYYLERKANLSSDDTRLYDDALRFLTYLRESGLSEKTVLVTENPLLEQVYELKIKPVVEIKHRVRTNKPKDDSFKEFADQLLLEGKIVMIGDSIKDALLIKGIDSKAISIIVLREHNEQLKIQSMVDKTIDKCVNSLDELIKE